jgi:hypothetical protein
MQKKLASQTRARTGGEYPRNRVNVIQRFKLAKRLECRQPRRRGARPWGFVAASISHSLGMSRGGQYLPLAVASSNQSAFLGRTNTDKLAFFYPSDSWATKKTHLTRKTIRSS